INIGAYGEDFKEPKTFEDLVNTLVKINEVERIRFGSIYPDKMNDEFIELFKNSKVMPHIHVSLQSGDDTVLNLMRRKYGSELIKEKMKKIKSEIPKMEFSADVIVGFPGETLEMHKNTYNLIEEIGFQDLHVFQYSDRENTLAEKMPNKVEVKDKKQRAEELDKLKEKMGKQIRESYMGKELSILVEEIKESKAVGYSENYLRISVNDENLVVGNIYKTSIKELQKGMLRGEEIK
ncbi:MAG: radical SAM protein, partial [Fusobacteriaceae bacterium]